MRATTIGEISDASKVMDERIIVSFDSSISFRKFRNSFKRITPFHGRALMIAHFRKRVQEQVDFREVTACFRVV